MSDTEDTKLTQALLHRILNYDPDTGHLTWREKVAMKVVVGARAGWSQPSKGKPYLRYRYVSLLGRRYAEHRLIWFWLHGEWPKHQIDHIDGNGEANNKANLRLAEPYENSQNTVRRSLPRSGYSGVYWHEKAGKWEAKINFRGGHHLPRAIHQQGGREACLPECERSDTHVQPQAKKDKNKWQK